MEEEIKNNYLLGIVGAIVGAFIGTIPWILMYIFSDIIYSILSILIVVCSFYGYKLTKAKIDKKLPVILSVVSFISITVTMFIIIPICLMGQSDIPISINNLLELYQYEEFYSAITTDYVVSILFCAIVIGAVIYNLNKQINEGKDSKDIKLIVQDASNDKFSNEDIDKVKSIFEKNDAMNKHQTISKDLIMEDLNREFGEEKAREIFEYLKIQKIIKKKLNRYYFSEKAQKSVWYRYGITNLKTFVIVIAIATILAFIIIYNEDMNNLNELQNVTQSDTVRDNVFDVGVDDMQLEFTDDIIMLTEDEITYYFGEEYADAYDCIALSSDFSKVIMVFTDDKSKYIEDYAPEEYLKWALDDDEVEVFEEDISGYTFYIVEYEYEGSDGNTYIEKDCVYSSEDTFVCIILDNIESNQIDLNEIVK